MKALRDFLDQQAKLFEPGGKLEKLYPLFEASDTILFTPGEVSKGPSHVRDGLDLKRMMITVVVALIPCLLWAMYNTGLQANQVIFSDPSAKLGDWHNTIYEALGGTYNPANVLACFVFGAIHFLPVLLVTFLIGGHAEVVFAVLRKHEINEGFLVTGFLFPLTLPPTIPLWQVAVGILFGVVLGKEIFGGTGMNFLNPALTARAFLFFSYPGQISGAVWIAAKPTDGNSGATWLASLAGSGEGLAGHTWWDAFLGTIPGSMGETSVIMILLGAILLIVTGVGSWRTMAGVATGTILMSLILNATGASIGENANPMLNVPFHWHMVIGSWAFATVFMATDPVSSAFTDLGRFIYGAGIGFMGLLVRCVNPAYPEGMMLAILFMNLFAPLIDHFIVQANIRRRKALYGRG